MTNFENREIHGITLRNLIALVAATVTIVAAVVYKTNSIETAIRDTQQHQLFMDSINSIRIREMDVRLEHLKNEVLENRRILKSD